MRKYIEISEEALARLVEGKYVEGSLHRDQWTGRITFNAWVRKSPKHPKDRMVCPLENGWLKESPTRYKFFNSVKKDLGQRLVNLVMHRELTTAMNVLEVEELLDNA